VHRYSYDFYVLDTKKYVLDTKIIMCWTLHNTDWLLMLELVPINSKYFKI